ncbi:MAG: hypothetical protein ACE5IP_07200 [Terriglobia bacterium]
MTEINPLMIPIVGIIFGCIMLIGIAAAIAIVRRERIRQETRLRELDYERRLRELQVQLEQARASQVPPKA